MTTSLPNKTKTKYPIHQTVITKPETPIKGWEVFPEDLESPVVTPEDVNAEIDLLMEERRTLVKKEENYLNKAKELRTEIKEVNEKLLPKLKELNVKNRSLEKNGKPIHKVLIRETISYQFSMDLESLEETIKEQSKDLKNMKKKEIDRGIAKINDIKEDLRTQPITTRAK